MQPVPLTTAPDAHICDVLIAERAPRLTGSVFWPALRPFFYRLLGYHHARTMADAVGPLSGLDALGHMSDLLALEVAAHNLDRIPATGRCVVVCNHPTGIADGIAVHDAVSRRRPDAIFFANADALRVAPRLSETVIPVEWVVSKRTREKTRLTLLAAKASFEAERCVVLFPAGRISRIGPDGALADPVWAATAASLARKYAAPVVPIHLAGPRSHLFHLFHRISDELRDITLFHELLNKQGKAYRLHVGRPVDPAGLSADPVEATLALKTFTERVLSQDPDAELA